MARSMKITLLTALFGILLSACASAGTGGNYPQPIHEIYKGKGIPGIR